MTSRIGKNNVSKKPTDHMLVMASEKVWVRNPSDGFLLGHIVDLGGDSVTVSLSGTPKKSVVPYENVYPAEDFSDQDYDDNCSLMYLNEATLLNNVRLRFKKNTIYTYIANMLIAVNPYMDIKGLYSEDTIKRYQGKSLGVLPPHVYAIADKSSRDLRVTKQSQSIIVSGESGSGKTETTKYILRFLCSGANSSHSAGTIEQKILDANPMLEAFGNAKTMKNNNSSRFGKFIEIHFNSNKLIGGYISHYLLEKSRICSQSSSERNYHIFYQLLTAKADIKKKLYLDNSSISTFNYLNQGCQKFFGQELKDPIVNDSKNFIMLEKALKELSLKKVDSIFETVASVLHLGNIDFEENEENTKGGCKIKDSQLKSLKITSKLLGLDEDELKIALTSRVMETGSKGGIKGTVIMVPLKCYEACSARDALAKAIYSNLFDYIVSSINSSIPFSSANSKYIGVLDIAGFEYFTINSFEQFCINYCNEKLQQFFNERVLHDEQTLYEKENLNIDKIEYVDNTDCIDLIECPKNSILFFLDEESKLPKPNYAHFTHQVHQHFSTHFRLAVPRKSKLKEHRELLDDQGFIVRHFAGAVCYNTQLFIHKNNDALHNNLKILVENSDNEFIRCLFGQNGSGSSSGPSSGKLNYVSIATKFRFQLNELLEKLRSTGTSFIRCIKPNTKMIPTEFQGGQILNQLQSAGMTSVLQLMQKGYPSRVSFSHLYDTYKSLMTPNLVKLDPRFFCRALFKAIGLNEHDFRFGLTKVFFKPGKFKEFDQVMRDDPHSLQQMLASVTKWIVQSKWKKAIFTVWSTIKLKYKILYRRQKLVTIQKNVKMHITRKRHQPRYRGILKIRKLTKQIASMKEATGKFKSSGNKEAVTKEVEELQARMESAIRTIRSKELMKETEIATIHQNILLQADTLFQKINKKIDEEKNEEERERARQIQAEMERQKAEKERAERAKQVEEETRRKKQELEAKRKKEEEELKKLAAARAQTSQVRTEEANRQEFEQNKRDDEMAYRLAQESNATLDDTNLNLKRSNAVVSMMASKKHDLTGWKYSDLRDAINTSCDVELLEACREEFHRRLKVYHTWKAKNSRNPTHRNSLSRDEVMEQRAPKSLYQHSQMKSNSFNQAEKEDNKAQRFFRIPFITNGRNTGQWLAHFDGQFVARQIELHDGKDPKLYIAGRDDMDMCELKLHETGLTSRRGAEILDFEFEREWSKHGGSPYIQTSMRSKP